MLRESLYTPWFADEQQWGFEIIDGMFTSVVVQIESVEFVQDSNNEVELNYHVISKPEMFDDELSKDPVFKSQVELIINDILYEAIETLKNEPDRDSST